MEDVLNKLKGNEFFQDLSVEEIRDLILNIGYNLRSYKKGEIIANEEDGMQ